MRDEKSKRISMDPRTGLFLLVMANMIAFTQDSMKVELGWIGVLTVLLLLCGRISSGMKWCLAFFAVLSFQWYVLPVSPKIIATSFSIFANYARRMFPCLMVGSLMVKTISLRQFIVGMRKLHVPQKLIISISVTLRYFPAIREEAGYIRDAMCLRNIRGMERLEAMAVPLMISASETAEELSEAAVTRGIENPAPKTSIIRLHMGPFDWIYVALSIVFAAAAIIM